MNADMAGALCTGRAALFDSTHPDDHARAKELCERCPVLAGCFQTLTEVRRSGPWASPQGTWAGQFLNNAQRRHRAAYKAQKAAS